MRIGLAQTKPLPGNISENISAHLHFAETAQAKNCDFLIFPEMSLTGYEPTLASKLAMESFDVRMDIFQKTSDNADMVIALGAPIKNGKGTGIASVIFQPKAPLVINYKAHLHQDELPFFVAGKNYRNLLVKNFRVGLAICYEISVEEHTRQVMDDGIDLYVASVAKFQNGIHKALGQLSETAQKFSKVTLMCNSIGQQDGQECAGMSSVWDNNGRIIEQLDRLHEGLLIYDTDSKKAEPIYQ